MHGFRGIFYIRNRHSSTLITNSAPSIKLKSFWVIHNCKMILNIWRVKYITQLLRLPHPLSECLGSSCASAFHPASWMYTMGKQGSSNYIPTTCMGDLSLILGYWNQPDLVPVVDIWMENNFCASLFLSPFMPFK